MDLRYLDDEPTEIERAAVRCRAGHAVVGLVRRRRGPRRTPGWPGPDRTRRHLLLPALHALQDRVGWISAGGLNHVCRSLEVAPAEAYGVASFYAMFSLTERPATVTHVCTDVACLAAGEPANPILAADSTTGHGQSHPANCLGLCDRAPAALVAEAGERPVWRAVPDTPTAVYAQAPVLLGPDRCRGRPHQPRRLPRRRRVRGAAPGVGARARWGAARADRIGPAGPGWRRVPHRAQVVRGGREPGPAPLSGRQRRRVRTGHVQGPGGHGGRPVRPGRSDDHRRVCHRLRVGVHLPARRVRAGAAAADRRHRFCPPPGPARRRRDGRRVPVRPRDPPGRGGLHLRRGDRPVQLDRRVPGRTPLQTAVPRRRGSVRQTDGREQRRDPGQRAPGGVGRRGGVRGHRHRRVERDPAVLPVGRGRADPVCTRCPTGSTSPNC